MTHTPGPWIVRKVGPRPHLEVMGPNDSSIAAMYGTARDVTDVRLIAAAPDLLDALRSIAEHSQEFGGLEDAETMLVRIAEKARAAIAKAEGQP